jgi:hypothetical protein
MAMLTLIASLVLLQTDSLLPPAPAGWRSERLALPPDFAPELEWRGVEDLLFAPGMFAPESDSYFSYVLALRVEEVLEVDERFLEDFLEKYYRGLCRAVGEERKLALDLAKVDATVRRGPAGFRAEVAMFDAFTTGAPLELALELEVRAAPRATELIGLASPLDQEAPIWSELRKLAGGWRAARPVPLLLNHLYVVPDRETFDAIAGSAFLRESFAVFEERTTVRADMSYSGLYLYGRNTYFEFLPPGAAGLPEGSTGIALGLETAGACEVLARALEERGVRTQLVPITRQLEAAQVPWFRMLGVQMPPSPLNLFVMEYDPRFLASWHATLPPATGGIERTSVLERYAAALDRTDWRAKAPLADVTEVRLALDEAQRERVLAVCTAGGYEVAQLSDGWLVHAPHFRLLLRESSEPGGLTGFGMRLREPLAQKPLQLGKAVVSFHGGTAELDFLP